jgi:hypothetical protein
MEATKPILIPELNRTGSQNSTLELNSDDVSQILKYLAHDLPGYRFEHCLDVLFVSELLADFPDTDVLEELKVFRWYYNNEPLSGVKNQRVVIRRWVARAARAQYR